MPVTIGEVKKWLREKVDKTREEGDEGAVEASERINLEFAEQFPDIVVLADFQIVDGSYEEWEIEVQFSGSRTSVVINQSTREEVPS